MLAPIGQNKDSDVQDAEKSPAVETTEEERRAFLRRATGVAVTAPAAALLLAASTKSGNATPVGSGVQQPPP